LERICTDWVSSIDIQHKDVLALIAMQSFQSSTICWVKAKLITRFVRWLEELVYKQWLYIYFFKFIWCKYWM